MKNGNSDWNGKYEVDPVGLCWIEARICVFFGLDLPPHVDADFFERLQTTDTLTEENIKPKVSIWYEGLFENFDLHDFIDPRLEALHEMKKASGVRTQLIALNMGFNCAAFLLYLLVGRSAH